MSIANKMIRWTVVCTVLASTVPVVGEAQWRGSKLCSDKVETTRHVPPFPDYALRRRANPAIDSLRRYLAAECWSQALTVFFKDSWSPRFVDWVVYIDSGGGVHQAIVKGRGPATELRDEKYVWAIVFSDRQMRMVDSELFKEKKDTAGKYVEAFDSTDLQMSRRVVNKQSDALIALLFKAFAGKVLSVEAPQNATLGDSTRLLEFTQLSADTTAPFYVAEGRFGLLPNTEVELSLRPVRGKEFLASVSGKDSRPRSSGCSCVAPNSSGSVGDDGVSSSDSTPPAPLRSVYANLGNAGSGWWDIGLTVGFTGGPKVLSYDDSLAVKNRGPGFGVNLYLTGVFNAFRQPKQPWSPRSLGIALGTNVARGSLLDDLVAGLAVGRIRREFGGIVGVSWTTITTVQDRKRVERRQPRAFLGLDMRL